jgi:hypothetical protein
MARQSRAEQSSGLLAATPTKEKKEKETEKKRKKKKKKNCEEEVFSPTK